MGEIRIHFKDVVITVFQSPFESGDVSRSQTEFAFAFQHVQAGKFFLERFHNIGGSIGRIVFYDQNVEFWVEREDTTNDVLYIFFFVVGRNNN